MNPADPMHKFTTYLEGRDRASLPTPQPPAVVQAALASDDPAMEVVHDAYREYVRVRDEAARALEAFREHVESDVVRDYELAVRKALADGKTPPAFVDPMVHAIQAEPLMAEVQRTRAAVGPAADRVSAAVTEVRDVLRPILLAPVEDAHRRAVEAFAALKAADSEQRQAVNAVRGLDTVTANAMDPSPGGWRMKILGARVADVYREHDAEDPSRFRQRGLSQAWGDVEASITGFGRVVALTLREDPFTTAAFKRAVTDLDTVHGDQ